MPRQQRDKDPVSGRTGVRLLHLQERDMVRRARHALQVLREDHIKGHGAFLYTVVPGRERMYRRREIRTPHQEAAGTGGLRPGISASCLE